MASDGLKKAVIDKARADADDVLAKAKKDAESALAAAKSAAERKAKELVEGATREAEEAKARELSSADRELRLEALKTKNALIHEAFDKAAGKFTQISADELRGLYSKELAGTDLNGATLLVAKGASGQFDDARAKGAQIKEDASLKGGYILSREDYRLDRSLRARLAELRGSLRGKLASTLFQEKA